MKKEKIDPKSEALKKAKNEAIKRIKEAKNFILFTGEQQDVADMGVAASVGCIAVTTNVVRLGALQGLIKDVTDNPIGERMFLEILKKHMLERILK